MRGYSQPKEKHGEKSKSGYDGMNRVSHGLSKMSPVSILPLPLYLEVLKGLNELGTMRLLFCCWKMDLMRIPETPVVRRHWYKLIDMGIENGKWACKTHKTCNG